MNILVTGGAGFIGSQLVAALVDAGAAVRVLDDFSAGERSNLVGVDVDIMEGDVADYDAVATAVAGCDRVYHLAALVSVPRSVAEPRLNHHVNLTGTFNVFEAARQAGVGRVVYASSAAVYGNDPSLPTTETSPVAPASPYGAAKLMGEQYAAALTATYGAAAPAFVALRYMNVYGPRQRPDSPYSGVLSLFGRAVLNGRALTVHGDGAQTRDFVYVADVVRANLLAGGAALAGRTAVFNIGSGTATSLNDIVAALRELAGPLDVRHGPSRPGDIRHSWADIGAARAALGYAPRVGLKEGLARTLAWLADHPG